jgi:hypothetical protein
MAVLKMPYQVGQLLLAQVFLAVDVGTLANKKILVVRVGRRMKIVS